MMAGRILPTTPILEKGKRRRRRVQPTAPGQRRPRVKDRAHLACIAALPSVISGRSPCVAAHLRYAEVGSGKDVTGMGRKPSDMWCLPLTPEEHTDHARAQHRSNERRWWEEHGVDPVKLCKLLYEASPDLEVMAEIVAAHSPASSSPFSAPGASEGERPNV